MKHKVKITILSALGVLLVGSSVAYAYSQKGTLISQKTEELPDGNIYVEELYEIIYVFLTIFLYLLKCPQSLIL